jgi:repressor LexA
MSIGSNIKRIRNQKNMTLEELAAKVGVSRQTLSRYETGIIPNISPSRIESLAAALATTPAELTGWNSEVQDYHPSRRIPILGRISAGLPLYAEEQVEGTVLADLKNDCEYFALRVKGDSMDAAHIFDGNILIVRKQNVVENGEIAVVMIDDNDATVKRFYCDHERVTLMPQSTNPQHQPQFYDTTKTSVRIIGKVVKNQIEFE